LPPLKQNARYAMLTREHLLSIPAHIRSVRTAWHFMCNPNSKPVGTPSFVRYALGARNIQHIPVVSLNRNYRINGLSHYSRFPLAIRKDLLTNLKITNDPFTIFKENASTNEWTLRFVNALYDWYVYLDCSSHVPY
jgi:hypothetical protein